MQTLSKTALLVLIVLVISCCSRGSGDNPSTQSSLVPRKYLELPLGAIKPEGWLLTQLEIMNRGTTGHLDETYSMLRDDNGWLGGRGESLEATPYWLDGAVPLAWLLDDQVLKAKVMKYIDWVIENQRPSGYFGPLTSYERETGKSVELNEHSDDWWPRMIMLKVLQQYYSATNDPRVVPFMTRYCQFQYNNLTDSTQLINRYIEQTANSRGQENVMMVYWLYQITREPFLLDLAEKLKKQTYAWDTLMKNRNWLIQAAAQQNADDWTTRHGVNVAMAIKTPAVYYEQSGDPALLDVLKTGFSDLMTLHGLPNGIFSADEDLHGNDPTQGTELCAIVEAMYSLEVAMGITGDPLYMDALERMTFNALPAQTTDDYNMRQYLQMPNQVYVSAGDYDFSYCEHLSNAFGALTGWYCCLVNMHQGWTKYATHLWHATPDQGVAALVYGPSTVTTTVSNGVPVTIQEETNYPFESTIRFFISILEGTAFPFELRIPEWCDEPLILLNGDTIQTESGQRMVRIVRTWNNNDQLTVDFPMQVRTSNWARNSMAIERGPLVYALKVGEQWSLKQDPHRGSYYEIYPTTPWNYGLSRVWAQ